MFLAEKLLNVVAVGATTGTNPHAHPYHRWGGISWKPFVRSLVQAGHSVICMDNLLTGRMENIDHLLGHERFTFLKYNVCDYLHVEGPLDALLHFASPASPQDYLEFPIATLKVGALGTHKALGLARAKGAPHFS